MTRLDRMRKQYEALTAAEGYIIGFHIGHDVYMVEFDRIPRRLTFAERECSRMGGGYGLYIEPKKSLMLAYTKKAVRVCSTEDLIDTVGYINEKGKQCYYNKGVMFEKLVYEMNGQEFRGKDNVRFTEAGDITINGREIQVKYGRARICYDKTLRKLSK